MNRLHVTVIAVFVLAFVILSVNVVQSYAHDLPQILYASDGGRQLITIDTTTGKALTKTSMSPVPTGRGFVGLTFDPNQPEKLFAGQGSGSADIYNIDTVTGLAKKVGNAGLGSTAINGMDSGADCNLYAVLDKVTGDATLNNHLVTINKATGKATNIGSLGVKRMDSIAFRSDGKLYGVSNTVVSNVPTTTLYEINPSTGLVGSPIQVKDSITGKSPSGGILAIDFGQKGSNAGVEILYAGTGKAVSPAKDGGLIGTIDLITGVFTKKGTATTGSPLEALADFPADNFPPKLNILGANPFVIQRGHTYTDPGATSNDCHYTSQKQLTGVSNVNTNVVGTYDVSYSDTDNTNLSSSATRAVDVIDFIFNSPYLIEERDTFTILDPQITASSISARIYSTEDPTGFTLTLTDLGGPSTFVSPPILFTEGSSDAADLKLHVVQGSRIFVEYRGVISDPPGVAGSTPTGAGSPPPSTDKVQWDGDASRAETTQNLKVIDATKAGQSSVQVTVKNDMTLESFIFTLPANPAGSGTFSTVNPVLFSNLLSTSASGPTLHVTVGDRVSATYTGSSPSFTATLNIVPTPSELTLIGTQPVSTTKVDCVTTLGSTDTDKDGICDIWYKTDGSLAVTLTAGGPVVYTVPCMRQLQAPGAPTDASNPVVCFSKTKKELLVHIDYMTNHRPDNNALMANINWFKTQNVNEFILVNEDVGYHQNIQPYFKPNPIPAGYNFHDVQSQKELHIATLADRTTGTPTEIQNRLTAWKQIWHWGFFGHQVTETLNASGYAEICGNDFAVTLGAFAGHVGTIDQQAAALMHETGHNLCLRHGGMDDINAKPNYISVMNYALEFPQESGGFLSKASSQWVLGLSTFKYNTIYENNLQETLAGGITGTSAPSRWTVVGIPSGGTPPQIVQTNTAVNWDADGITGETGYSSSVNRISIIGVDDTAISTLNSQNDMTAALYNFRPQGTFSTGLATVPHTDNDADIVNIGTIAPPSDDTADPLVGVAPTDPKHTSNEGEHVTGIPLATVVDYDSETITVEVNWGDGSTPETQVINRAQLADPEQGVFNIFGDHTYVDDNPSNTTFDTYTVTVKVTNNRGGETNVQLTTTVNNVNPIMSPITMTPATSPVVGEERTIDATFTDAGVDDTHTATIDWGDGTTTNPATLTEPHSPGTITGTHSYNVPGTYTVTATVSDDDGGSASQTIQITVEKFFLSNFISPIDNSNYNLNRSIPVKVAVTNSNGQVVTNANVYVFLDGAPAISKNLTDNKMVFNASTGQYVYELSFPADTSTGSHIIEVRLAGADPDHRTVTIFVS